MNAKTTTPVRGLPQGDLSPRTIQAGTGWAEQQRQRVLRKFLEGIVEAE